jgi:ligand-binding sensor domain-containing protein
MASHPLSYHAQLILQAIVRQYLQEDDKPETLSWKSLTTHDGLPHNWIYDLYQDSQGRICVGTWGGGLALHQSGKWKIYTTQDGLHSNAVTCIREDPQGRLWLATDNGLNLLQDGRIQDAGLKGKSLLNMTFDRKGHLWVGAWRLSRSSGGLFRFDGKNWQAYTIADGLPGMEILKVFEDSRGNLWTGTYEDGAGAGVGCYDGRQWRVYTKKEPALNGVKGGLADNCVYSMFEDPAGNMWFGTIGGVSIFRQPASWDTLTREDGLVDNRVYCMLIDSQKKMWFGTEGGVSRLDGSNWLSFTRSNGLVENLVRAIIETRDGSLWFGTYPYAQGAGGISIATHEPGDSLVEKIRNRLAGRG